MIKTVEEWLGKDNKLGIDIWERKYQYNNETFEEWLDRVSGGDLELKRLIEEKKFLFGGRILAGRGTKENQCYSNCFVLSPPNDNIESIFETAKESARTFSYGGGVGFDLSKLRAKGMAVHNSAKETTGAVSFMDLYSMVTGLIGQKNRRGALMLSMDVTHPDILEFINVKKDLDKVTKANISVRVDDNFMKAVKEDKEIELKFTVDETEDTLLTKVKARVILREIAQSNWEMAEPGMLFWDTINEWNLTSGYEEYKIVGTNPCGEQPLSDYSSCLLGSLNLSEFIDNPFTSYASFDEKGFIDAIHIAVRAMDDVLEENIYRLPLKKQIEKSRDWRQIGIGQMGLADALIKLGITYGSDKAIEFIKRVGHTFINESMRATSLLAKVRGTFPKYDYNSLVQSDFFNENINDEIKQIVEQYGMRNCALLSIAPNGSISTMIGTSGGIEPQFSLSYNRRTETMGDTEKTYKVYAKIARDYMDIHGDMEEEDLPSFFITSQKIPYINRIKMQSAFQRYIDTAISSTINLPNEATVEDIEDIYMKSWEYGLKGITCYRDGCFRQGVLTTDDSTTEEIENINDLKWGEAKDVAEDTIYMKRNILIGCGKLKLFIGYSPSEQSVQDLYVVRSGSGGCEKNIQALCIAMSYVLRLGGDTSSLRKAFSGISGCPSFSRERALGNLLSKGSYCGIAILNEVDKFLEEVEKSEVTYVAEVKDDSPTLIIEDVKVVGNSNLSDEENEYIKKYGEIDFLNTYHKCPSCGGNDIQHVGGCVQCSCGFSKCS